VAAPRAAQGVNMRQNAASIRLLLAVMLTGVTIATGCSTIERAKPGPQPARVDRSIPLDVPRIMRGTIASETIMLGYQPVVVRGWGLVVGLKGTGSRQMAPAVRAHMLADMARRGVGQRRLGMGYIEPEQLLDSPNTSVVVVEAVIPPGAVGSRVLRGGDGRVVLEGTRFDVRVYADPASETTSLEGGRLYSCDLRPSRPGETLPPTGSRQAAPIAVAKGPVFINPFVDPATPDQDTVNRNAGRILDGGEVSEDMPIKLRLATPSHARAEIIQSAINTRFPREPGQSDDTAHGESDELIRINVPPSFHDAPDDFVELLRHTTIRQANPELVASSIKRILRNDPSAARAAAWRWEALGPKILPVIRDMYDYPEELPRLAALRAGARLSDPMVVPDLIDMTRSESAEIRRRAVGLLGSTDFDPRVDLGLRAMLNDEAIDVRLAAYEALTRRNDPFIDRVQVEEKFVLDLVPSEVPMIYVTQIGRPRIAVFGTDLAVDRPIHVDIWTGRFMLRADSVDEQVEVYYRPAGVLDSFTQATDPRLDSFVRFLGRRMTIEQPEPGLDMSYAQAVGALYQIQKAGYIDADFKFEQDRIRAEILRQMEGLEVEERPEFTEASPEEDEAEGANSVSDLERIAPPPGVG
jgi:flagellar basal body P-ring protein FlgI